MLGYYTRVCASTSSQEITIGLLKTALLSRPDAVGFLIDGFPRNLQQGKLFVQQVGLC